LTDIIRWRLSFVYSTTELTEGTEGTMTKDDDEGR
jgi:hypothetical protein